jgi:lipopolysaccharide/colanic/teichoic acid biosynthesis glycosyltransferase
MSPTERRLWAALAALGIEGLLLSGAWTLTVAARSALTAHWPKAVTPLAHVAFDGLWSDGAVVVPIWIAVGLLTRAADGEPRAAAGLATLTALAAWTLWDLPPVSRLALLAMTVPGFGAFAAADAVRQRLLAAIPPWRVLAFGAAASLDGVDLVQATDDDVEAAMTADGIDAVFVGSGAEWLWPRVDARARLLGLPVARGERVSVARPSARHAVKRLLDGVGAFAGLVFALPALLLTAAAIRLDDGGPVLFRQVRMGRRGRPFVLWKLRTMRVGAEAELAALRPRNEANGPVFKLRDDPRVTRVGRWLRRMSIDELPQLVNVLRGDMSLVGPRPALPDEVARYEPSWRRRLSVRPGLTGPGQVAGRSDLEFRTSLALDLAYVDRGNLGSDLWLLLATIPAVLRARGAH